MKKEKESVLGLAGLYVLLGCLLFSIWHLNPSSLLSTGIMVVFGIALYLLWRFLRTRGLIQMTGTSSMLNDENLPTRERVFIRAILYLIIPPTLIGTPLSFASIAIAVILAIITTFLIIRVIGMDRKQGA